MVYTYFLVNVKWFPVHSQFNCALVSSIRRLSSSVFSFVHRSLVHLFDRSFVHLFDRLFSISFSRIGNSSTSLDDHNIYFLCGHRPGNVSPSFYNSNDTHKDKDL